MNPLECIEKRNDQEGHPEQKLLYHHVGDTASMGNGAIENPEEFQNRLDISRETKQAIKSAI